MKTFKTRIGLFTSFLTAALCSTVAIAENSAVKIGVLNDQSTIYAAAGGVGSVVAAQLAADDAGPVLGKAVEIVTADHQNKADIGGGIARKWFDADGVDMITDVPNSGVGFAVQNLAAQYKKLALLTGTLSADFTGPRCNAYSAAWAIDTYSQPKALGPAVVRAGGDTWFFIAADYAFGRALVADTSKEIEARGGVVKGAVYAPLNTADFSSFLLQAQASKAKIIGLANATADTVNAIKQGREYGLDKSGQKFVAFVMFIHDVKSLGLPVAQGLQLATPFYWDLDDQSRAFGRRFQARVGTPPTWDQAAVYSVVNHYLKAVKAVGAKDSDRVMAKMRELPIEDFMSKSARLRIDGRVERDMHVFEVKAPAESKGEWDLYKYVATVPRKDAFRSMADGGCPLAAGQAK